MALRTPDNYTISVPRVYFACKTEASKEMQVDWLALANAIFGITDASGNVKNSYGNIVGTRDEILAKTYLGNLEEATVGGDVTTLEHYASIEGIRQLDKQVVLSRPITYELTLAEVDEKNMNRFIVGSEIDLTVSDLKVTGKTFYGSESETICVVTKKLNDPSKAKSYIEALWKSKGGSGNPPCANDHSYAFIIAKNPVGNWANLAGHIAYVDCNGDWDTWNPNQDSPLLWSFLKPAGTGATADFAMNKKVKLLDEMKNPVSGNNWATANIEYIFNSFDWVKYDTDVFGYTVVGTPQSIIAMDGAAAIISTTDIGHDLVHIVPRCSLIPSGDLGFSSDSWLNYTLTLTVLRDDEAQLKDRTPYVDIPYGYLFVCDLS